MIPLLIYFLKSGCFLFALYIGFRLLLAKETFSGFNRKVLQVGIISSLLLPFVSVEKTPTTPVGKAFHQIEQQFIQKERQPENLQVQKQKASIDWEKLIVIIYCTGAGIHLILLIYALLKTNKIIRSGIHLKRDNYTLVTVLYAIPAFTWGKYIVISGKEDQESFSIILAHEIAHRQLNHFIDILAMELLIVFHWFNPAIRLLRREMKNIHEYQADRSVLTSGINEQKYQLLLVKKAAGYSSYTFANSFNHSKIKKRITMMLKENSNPGKRSKLLLLFPVVVALVYAFSGTQNTAPISSKSEDTTISQQMDSSYPKVHYQMAVGDDEEFIHLTFLSKEQKENRLLLRANTSEYEIRKLVAPYFSESYLPEEVIIKAGKNIPMGQITDLKSLLAELAGFLEMHY